MEPFRVLIIVLASDTDPVYCRFQTAWRLASHNRADILFLKAHPDVQGGDFVCGDTIYIKCNETLEKVYEKQMRGFKLLRPKLKEYAFIFRTNLSSFLDIPTYLKFCETLPRTKVYSGVIGTYHTINFASGSGFTITPDMVYRLLDENPPEICVDDVSIGGAIANWGIPIIPAPRLDYYPQGWFLIPSEFTNLMFHRRIKTDDRFRDSELLFQLFKPKLNTLFKQ